MVLTTFSNMSRHDTVARREGVVIAVVQLGLSTAVRIYGVTTRKAQGWVERYIDTYSFHMKS